MNGVKLLGLFLYVICSPIIWLVVGLTANWKAATSAAGIAAILGSILIVVSIFIGLLREGGFLSTVISRAIMLAALPVAALTWSKDWGHGYASIWVYGWLFIGGLVVDLLGTAYRRSTTR